ncbi:MAG: hypothetical protein HY078_03105 [Elusimicrobia bacterium]|nr:hypothetical protein [Elusimicrobiota bacterium]
MNREDGGEWLAEDEDYAEDMELTRRQARREAKDEMLAKRRRECHRESGIWGAR